MQIIVLDGCFCLIGSTQRQAQSWAVQNCTGNKWHVSVSTVLTSGFGFGPELTCKM